MERSPGRPEAERIVAQYADALYRFALVMLKNSHDAEDAVQDTLLRYMERAPRFDGPGRERAWLFTVAANRCRDTLREARRHPRAELDELSVESTDPEDAGVLDALMGLPEKYRETMLLHYVEGYGTREIARMIGRTPSAVKMRLKKGRELLEAQLGKEQE